MRKFVVDDGLKTPEEKRRRDKAVRIASLDDEIRRLGYRAYRSWGAGLIAFQEFETSLIVNLTTHRQYGDTRLLNLADEMWNQFVLEFKLHIRVVSGLRESTTLKSHLHQALLTEKPFTAQQIERAIGFIKGFWARHGSPSCQDIGPPESSKAFGYICHKNQGVSEVFKTYCPKVDDGCRKRKGSLPACPHKLR